MENSETSLYMLVTRRISESREMYGESIMAQPCLENASTLLVSSLLLDDLSQFIEFLMTREHTLHCVKCLFWATKVSLMSPFTTIYRVSNYMHNEAYIVLCEVSVLGNKGNRLNITV